MVTNGDQGDPPRLRQSVETVSTIVCSSCVLNASARSRARFARNRLASTALHRFHCPPSFAG